MVDRRNPSWLRALAMAICLLLVACAMSPGAHAANNKYAAMVVEASTGQVLFARHATKARYPASMTKMMTAYMVFEALDDGRLDWNGRVKVSRQAANMPPTKLGLRAGSRVKVGDLVGAMVTKSSNDAAVVLAEALGGTEENFARMMTARARSLGMVSTTFKNASGLPDPMQVSTARDMVTLSRALIYDFPDYYTLFSARHFAYGNRVLRNTNRLMTQYDGMDGIKTGYIRASGFNLAASAERDGVRLIAIVFGGRTTHTRDAHIAELLDEGFARVRQLDVPRDVTAKLVQTPVGGVETVTSYGRAAAAPVLPSPRKPRPVALAIAGDLPMPVLKPAEIRAAQAQGDDVTSVQ